MRFGMGLSCVLLALGGMASTAQAQETKPLQDLTLKDIRYLPRTLAELGDAKGHVLFFHASTCAPSVERMPGMVALEAEYRDKGVNFAAVNAGADDTIKHMAYHALVHNLTFPLFKDRDGALAAAVGVEQLPAAVLLDAQWNPVWTGDPAALGNVLSAHLGGAALPAATAAPETCAITRPVLEPLAEPITYSSHIAPFLNSHCVRCHHDGGGAPVDLTNYKRVVGNVEMLSEVVGEGRMPPWYAHPDFGEFRDEPGITQQQREMFAHWMAAGMPEGDPAELPETPQFDLAAWQIEPDVIVEATQVSAVPKKGYVPYQYIFMPWVAQEDTYVQAFEIKPTNAKVVHHANLIFVRDGFQVDEAKDFITGYVPGGMPSVLDGDRSWFIPKGASLCFQVHLVTTGKLESNRMQLGMRFARGVVNKKVYYFNLDGGRRFAIPANDRAWQLRDSDVLDVDATGLGLFVHMHLRGKDAQFFAHYPDGRSETLMALPNYNFDWQLTYRYPPEAFRFPAGTKIECVAHYDNSGFNPYNPAPEKEVRRGPQTVDEMLNGFFVYTRDDEQLGLRVDPATGHPVEQLAAAR